MVKPLFNARAKQQFRDLANGAVASSPSTVQIAKKSGRDRYGDSHDAPAPYTAFVVYKQQMVTNGQGDQVKAKGLALFEFPAPIVDVEDLLTLPDGTSAPIIAVEGDPATDPMIPTVVYF